jgi:hypothetical protein
MPLPLILAAAALSGGMGALSGYGAASAEQKRITDKNKQLDEARKRIEAERNKMRQATRSTAADFISNYAAIRDPQRAEGIRNTYSGEISQYRGTEAQLGSQIANLELQKEGQGMSPLNASLLGGGMGAIQGAMSAAALQLGGAGGTAGATGTESASTLLSQIPGQTNNSESNPWERKYDPFKKTQNQYNWQMFN